MIPIETLNLPIRPFNVLKRNRINYIEQVLQLGIDGLTALKGLSPTSAEFVFVSATEFANQKGIPIPTKQPSNLPTLAGDEQPKPRLPIHLLNLSNISRNVLKRNKIDYAEQIIELRVNGLVSRTGISNATARKIYNIAQQALNDPKLAGFEDEFDIVEEHIEDRKTKLPENLNDYLSPDNKLLLPKLLPHLIKDILLFEQRERFYEVLTRRFGLEGNNTYTLDEIGLYYGLTRERVRQMEDKAIKFLRGSLVRADFHRKSHQLDKRVITEIGNFIKVVKSTNNSVLPEDILLNIIQDHYSIIIDSRLAAYYRLLLEICGFQPLPGKPRVQFKSAKSGWVIEEGKEEESDEIWTAFDSVYKILREAGVAIELFDLIIEVNRPRKKKRLSNWAIETAISLCEDIECLNDNLYQLKLHKLNRSQQVYRIFVNGPRQVRNGKDICKEINFELAKLDGSNWDLQTMSNLLVSDDRFIPIGRQGWILKEWSEIESDDTIQLIHKLFNKIGKPLSVKEIRDEILKVRRISEQTLYVYLSDKSNFVRVGRALYQPINWSINTEHQKVPIRKVISAEESAIILGEIFRDVGQDAIPLHQLAQKFSEQTGVKNSYQTIQKSPVIRLEPDKNDIRRKIAYFIPIHDSKSGSPEKVTLRDRISEFVRQRLSKMPLRSIELKKLVQQATRELKCQKPTFYYYLSEMEDVVKTKLETGETVCTLVEKKSALTFPEAATIANDEVKAEVERAISLLSLDTVDFCLFHLGKVFEHTVTEYVDLASTKRIISATDHDKRNLANRLDCLVRNGIITNKRTVDYLRQERNARAHELGERQAMMREAPELAQLYIKNIADLQGKIEKLKEP